MIFPARTPGPRSEVSPESPAAADAPSTPAPPVVVEPPSTAELVAGSVATWRASLVEAAGGSTLADVELLGDAALDLSAAHPSGVAQLFAGRPTRLSNLVRDGVALTTAKRRARAVGARADHYAQRYGIAPTYLAIGVATWTERTTPDVATDDVAALAAATRGAVHVHAPVAPGVPAQRGPVDDDEVSADVVLGADDVPAPRTVRAPVLLRPVALHARGSGESDYELALEPSLEVNPVLARALRSRGALLDPAALARGAFNGSGFDPRPALDRLTALGAAVLEDFELEEQILVGTFVHPGQVLVDDLDQLSASLAHNEIVAALAGDDDARRRLARTLPAPVRGDREPDLERGVGDLDPAQQHVLDVLATGEHLFIDAPAGCDVTGTLAAVVADAAASGRSVLVVPGHRRAGSALAARLTELGLDDLLLDVAPDAGWRTAAARRLLGAMTLEAPPADPTVGDLRTTLVDRREQLRGYVTALHLPRAPWDASAYDALQALAKLTSTRPAPQTRVRLSPDVARVLEADRRAELGDALARVAALGAFSIRPSDTPWYGADLRTAHDAELTLQRLERLLGGGLALLAERMDAVATQTGLTAATTVGAWGEQLAMLGGIRGALDVFQPMIFERSAADMIAATATRTWRAERDIRMGRILRRRLRRQAKDMVRPGRPLVDLHAALQEVQVQREIWQAHCPAGGWPRLPEWLSAVDEQYRSVRADVDALEAVLASTPGGAGLVDVPLPELVERLRRLHADRAALVTLPERSALLHTLTGAGLGPLLEDLAARRVPAAVAGSELELAWWTTVFEQVLLADPALAGYDGAALGALAAEYRALDRRHVASLAEPVRRAVLGYIGSALRTHRAQAEALFAELVEDRMTSLRDTATRFPDLVRRLRPVLVASPMLVPQVLPPNRTVDLVVLDSVQHLPLEVALAAIARGRQVVVVGDARCASGSAVRELADVLPGVALRADATRRDPYLTAFLAAHGYAGVLSPTPLPQAAPLVHLDVVDATGMPDPGSGAVDSTRAEVDHVVELAITHALTRPEESLAVITPSPVHADQVREAVLAEVRDNPALAAFFDAGRPEPFVVADLTGVAGLRRDAVLLSVGYGRTPHGRVLHKFGPLSGPGGDALLLDALGATRHRLGVVAAFGAADLDPERLRGPGARLLADLLEFAERRGRGDGTDVGTSTPAGDEQQGPVEAGSVTPASSAERTSSPDRLVIDLAERLWRHGLLVEVDYGVAGGTHIPLAVGHPDVPDELLVAVLIDDDAYVAEPSVRVRDRQVAERLERLGWGVVPVWSAAAFLDPEAEVDRIRRAVHTLVDARPAPTTVVVPARPEPEPEDDPDEAGVPAAAVAGTAASNGVASPNGTASKEPSSNGTPRSGHESLAPSVPFTPIPVTAEQPALAVRARPRPPVERGLPISAYGDDQLDDLLQWLVSDGVERGGDELAAALREELGLTRRGSRIDAVIGAAVRRVTA